jgi:hypothetical protein
VGDRCQPQPITWQEAAFLQADGLAVHLTNRKAPRAARWQLLLPGVIWVNLCGSQPRRQALAHVTDPTLTVTCVCVRCGDACSAQLLGEAAKDTRLLHASIAYQIVPMGGLTTRDLEQVRMVAGRQGALMESDVSARTGGRDGRA